MALLGPQKGAHFGPKRPFLGPLRSSESLGGQIWSQLPLIGPTQLVTWHPHTLAWYRPSSGPLGPQKGQFWPQMSLLGTQRSQEGPRGQNLVLTATGCSARVKLMVTTHTLTWSRPSSGPPGAPKGPVLAQNVPFWGRKYFLLEYSHVGCLNSCIATKFGPQGAFLGPLGPQKGHFGPKLALLGPQGVQKRAELWTQYSGSVVPLAMF